MTARRVTAIALLLALACTLAAAPAQAGVLAPEDSAELAQSLADAQEEQGICYGWRVDNNFDRVSDVGSSTFGPSIPVAPGLGSCEKYVELTGRIEYSCEDCDAPDSAAVAIKSSLPNAPTKDDLEALGLKAGDLTGDKDDTTLINMVNALPLLAADRGLAPYLAYEPAKDVPATDHATGKPGSDLLRDRWAMLLLCGVLIAAGLGLYLYKRYQRFQPISTSDSTGAT